MENQIKNQITNGNIESALDLMAKICINMHSNENGHSNEIIVYRTRLRQNNRDRRLGIIDLETYYRFNNQLIDSVLNLLEEIIKDPEFEWAIMRMRKKEIYLLGQMNSKLIVSLSQMSNNNQDVKVYEYGKFPTISDLLNTIYFDIEKYVNPYTYGKEWILRDVNSDKTFENPNNKNPQEIPPKDERTLKEVGIYPDMTLEIIKMQ